MTPAKAPIDHIGRVDVLRATAFLLVFFFHFLDYFPGTKPPWNGQFRDYSALKPVDYALSPLTFGWLGVALFFVISGFCIHYSILKSTKPFTAKSFFERRFLRIYPAYLVNIIGCLLLVHWLPSSYLNFWQVAAHLAMVHNLVKSTFTGINWVLWSLGVEWQFYLLFPLLLWGRSRIGLTGCLVLALVANVICQIYFSVRFAMPGIPVSVDWSFPLVTWCDWILGACLAEAFVEKRPLFPHNTHFLIGSFLLLAVSVNFKPLSMQSYLISSVFFAALMDRYLPNTNPLAWWERLLVPVGLVSYSLYLWHQPVIRLGISAGAALHLPQTPLLQWLVYFPLMTLVTAIISIASYHWIEVGVPRLVRSWRAPAKAAPATV